MADKEASLLIKLKDQASAGLGKLAGQLAAVSAAVAAMKVFVVDSIKAFMESEQSVNRLNIALKNQGIYSDQLSKDMQKYAAQLQRTTTFSDEQILSAQSLMLTFGLQGAELKRATQGALDLSTAMGIDLQTASLLLGKAFQGQTEALSRYGIKIDDTIPRGERFDALMEKLNYRFGGSAQADLDTYAGKIKNLGNQFDEFKESVGRGFIPILELSMSTLGGFLDRITDLMGNEQAQTANMERQLYDLMAARENLKIQAQEMGTLEDAQTQQMILAYDTEIAKINELLLAETEADNQSLLSKAMVQLSREQIWAKEKKNRQEGYKAFLANEKSIADVEKQNRQEGYKAFVENEKAQDAFDKQMALEKVNTARNSLSMISSLSTAKNKELAIIGKGAAIALATMDTLVGANKALAQLGIFGPPAAALIYAAGMANVARIAGIEVAEGGMVMPRAGGVPLIAGEAGQPEVVIPLGDERTNEMMQEAGVGGSNLTINIGTLIGSENNVRELARIIDRELFTLRRNNESVSLGAL